MAKTVESMIDLIGDSPLVRIKGIFEPGDRPGLHPSTPRPVLAPGVKIYGKLESRNPGASVKDRIALHMIEQAEISGMLKPGSTIIEPTSGNTGIGLAWIGALKGYRVILTMPESMSIERRKLLKAYGAEIVLTPAIEGMKGAIAKAEKLLANIPGSFSPGQFTNQANPQAHYQSTGPEIWEALEGNVDILVAGVGTGGTISGAGAFLKEKNPAIRLVAVEPSTSQVLAGEPSGSHLIQGIGAGFVPKTFNGNIVDEIIPIESHMALAFGKELSRRDALLVGISSAANVLAAALLGSRPENAGKTIVTILCDTGERYLSTLLFFED